MNKIICIALIWLFPLTGMATGIWDVYSFGAKGDGKTLDTHAIQQAIDECHRRGGGKVYLHNGTFLSGTIVLRSYVTLYVESGAVLLGSDSPADYPVVSSRYLSVSGEYLTDPALIYAEGAESIVIAGSGTIDGRGDDLHTMEMPRPHIVHFRNCNNVKIRHIRLYNAAFWVQKYQACNDLLIEGITVETRENKDIEQARFADVPGGRNTDGCNIVDCRRVRIANCNIDSGDDGIVFKSFSQKEGCSDITVTNCIITTNASGIKIGTESSGKFNDITINNCVIYDTRGAAIGFMTVDGAAMERILVSDITLRNIKGTAIFLRLANRGTVYRAEEGVQPPGSMKDILIHNIYGTEIERYGCSITGIPGALPENIVLDNINLSFTERETPLLFEGYEGRIVQQLDKDSVPELETVYPRGEMFGKLPAYGFYVRHVDGITFNNIRLTCGRQEKRPALITDDVKRLFVNGFRSNGREVGEPEENKR
ncbi:MAG: glycoside hydrolase family 28 protein [Bacteroides sp.]|nr:glycoside hydrolase family 28 protein [Bacteroides sp.]